MEQMISHILVTTCSLLFNMCIYSPFSPLKSVNFDLKCVNFDFFLSFVNYLWREYLPFVNICLDNKYFCLGIK